MKRILSLVALSGALALAAPARADIIYTFATASFNGTLGTSQTYGLGSDQINTYGYTSALSAGPTLTIGAATDLYAKYSGVGASETGLGINNDPTGNHEITTTSTIAINMSTVLAANPTSNVTFTIGSVQNTEGFALFGGPLNGSSATSDELYHFTNTSNSPTQFSFTITAAQAAASGDVFYLTATHNNVLLDTIDVASVPEPATITLALTGVAFVGGFGWLRRRSAQA